MTVRGHPFGALARTVRRFGRLTATVGLIAWAGGSLWSILSFSPGYFQRFGALGVAAAVLFFTDRLMQIELARQRTVEKLLHEYGLELEVLRSGTPPTDIPVTGYVIDFLTEERNFDQLRSSADRINVANISLLTMSTLQWGFGDLLLAALAQDGGV